MNLFFQSPVANPQSSPSEPPHPVFKNVLPAVLSGVLLTAAFPPGHFSMVAWIALVPLLMSIREASPKVAFRLGFFSGLTHYLTLIYWIVVVLGRYGNLNIFVSLLSLFLLSAYLSLYLGLFSTLAVAVRGSRFTLLLLPAFWVALEYVRAHLISGFPWCLMGYTQYKTLPLIQVADVVGVYGVSFFIVLVNALIFRAMIYHTQPGPWLKWEMILVFMVTGLILAYGFHSLSQQNTHENTAPHLRTAVIQANIDQSLKWDPTYQTETLRTYERLTRGASVHHPELIVWPETALPFFFQDNLQFSPGIFALSQETGALLLFGSPAYERVNGVTRYYNRAYLITPGSGEVETYDKVHLVPFGEYVPCREFLPFLNQLVQAAGDFVPGETADPLVANDLSLGVLICFEAIFPELARRLVNQGANVLVNLTNDAWFGMSSAPYQHLSMAVFRSVENNRPMIRAANTGFSAFIGPRGKIRSQSSLFSQAVLHHSVALRNHGRTYYSRLGDLFALGLVFLSAAKILPIIWTAWKKRKPAAVLNRRN
ncbi:MAG: apolipoprotein N-acyltransferase [Thermodesulfobacteriota bacterium]